MRSSLAALAILFGATAANGQSDPSTWHEKATEKDLQEFGACAIRKHPALAREMITNFAAYSLDDKYLKVLDPDCLGVVADGMKLPGGTEARFMIAQALVRDELRDISPTLTAAPLLPYPQITEKDFAAFQKLPLKKRDEAIDKFKARASAALAALAFGECVARSAPADSRAFVVAPSKSNDEMKAASALAPSLSRCVNKGQQFTIDKTGLRGVLAVALYRLAAASRSRGAPAK